MGRFKRKSHFTHAQNVRIHIIRAFNSRLNILQYPLILFEDSKGPNQTARTRRPTWAVAAAYARRKVLHGAAQMAFIYVITKTYLYNYDPLKPYFYIVKLGFTGVNFIFLILLKKYRLCVFISTASPRQF